MKILYAIFVCLFTTAGAAFISLNPVDAVANDNETILAEQKQVVQLMEIVLPPYKRSFN